MQRERFARAWFAVTAAVVAFAVVTEMVLAFGPPPEDAYFTSTPGRLFNLFTFFTIQSNIILGVTSLLLALRLDRRSTLFAVLRLDGVLAITVTGLVYNTVLIGLIPLQGWSVVTNVLLHVVAPLLGFLGWVLFGPRGLVDGRVVGLATIFPLAWLAFTLLRGPVVDWYPYPFVDVIAEGYPRVLLNSSVITVLWLGLAAGVAYADRWLLARQRPVTTAGVPAGAEPAGAVLERGPDERRLEGEPPPGDEPRVGQPG